LLAVGLNAPAVPVSVLPERAGVGDDCFMGRLMR
jgi:hypothetical protein